MKDKDKNLDNLRAVVADVLLEATEGPTPIITRSGSFPSEESSSNDSLCASKATNDDVAMSVAYDVIYHAQSGDIME